MRLDGSLRIKEQRRVGITTTVAEMLKGQGVGPKISNARPAGPGDAVVGGADGASGHLLGMAAAITTAP